MPSAAAARRAAAPRSPRRPATPRGRSRWRRGSDPAGRTPPTLEPGNSKSPATGGTSPRPTQSCLWLSWSVPDTSRVPRRFHSASRGFHSASSSKSPPPTGKVTRRRQVWSLAPEAAAGPLQAGPLFPRQPRELAAELLQAVGPQGVPLATHHCETQRPIEPREVASLQPAGLPFLEAQPGHPTALVHLVLERHAVSIQMQGGGERLEPGAHVSRDGGVDVEVEARIEEVLPRVDTGELSVQGGGQALGRGGGDLPARAPPVETEPLERAAQARLVRMRSLAGEQRVAQRGARRLGELGGKRLGQRLGLALQQEPEVLHRADPHEAPVPAAAGGSEPPPAPAPVAPP